MIKAHKEPALASGADHPIDQKMNDKSSAPKN